MLIKLTKAMNRKIKLVMEAKLGHLVSRNHQKLVFTRNDSRFPAQIYKGEQFEFMARESVKGTLKRK